MKLNFAIICDNAFTDKTGRLNIIQTFDSITTPGFPAIHPRLTITTSFKLEDSDSRTKDYIQTVIIEQRDPKKAIARLETTNKPMEGIKNIQFVAYFVGIKFDQEGIYDVKIKLDKKEFPPLLLSIKKT